MSLNFRLESNKEAKEEEEKEEDRMLETQGLAALGSERYSTVGSEQKALMRCVALAPVLIWG